MAPPEPAEYVTLISNDDFEFIVLREAACVAGTMKKMLDPQSQSPTPIGRMLFGNTWADGRPV